MYEQFVIVCVFVVGRRGDVPEGGDGLMADGGVAGWISSHCGVVILCITL